MIIPKNENRKFDTEILNNNIKVVYVNDMTLDKTSVSVSVNVGSYSNPSDAHGLAHFLEHMLFLGSEKYPQENYYEINLKKYGGSSNAFTAMHQTVYFFSVFNNGLEHLMDIFSHFFIDPIFDENSVLREINAVNSEHLKNINDDSWKINQVYKNLAMLNNPYNTFPTGSLKTMNKQTIRQKMIDFYNKYYVSENIGICIVSNLDIKKQQHLIHNTFGKILKKKAPEIIIQKPIYDIFGKTFQIIPEIKTQQMSYIWEIPNNVNDKLFDILSNILSTRYKKSLTNFLKINGMVNKISTYFDKNVGLYYLDIDLTLDGLSKFNTVDGYIKYALKKIFSQDWSKIISYYKKIFQFNFDNIEKTDAEDLSLYLVQNIHIYDLKNVYYGDYMINKVYSILPESFTSCFNKSIKILICDKNMIKNIIIDKNYGTKYGEINNINYDKIKKFDFTINLQNDFLNAKPSLITLKESNVPILLNNNIWYYGTSKFKEPIVKYDIIFNNSNFFSSPKNVLLTNIAIDCIVFYLRQELYNILTVGFDIYIRPNIYYDSVILSFSCLNDTKKINQFISLSLTLIKNIEINSKIIESKILEYKQSILNIKKLNPWNYSDFYFTQQTYSNCYNSKLLLSILSTIQYNNVIDHINCMFNDSSVEVLIVGNINKKNIMNNDMMKLLTSNNNNNKSEPSIKLLSNISINHPNKKETNNCVTMIYYVGEYEPQKMIHIFLLYLILEQPFHDELRTLKQLGYLVALSISNINNIKYIYQKIQSTKKCSKIKKEILLFNDNIINILKKINLDEWKKTTMNYLKEKDNNISDISYKCYDEIINKTYQFNRNKLLLKELKNVSIKSLICMAKKYILKNESTCCIEIVGN